MPLYLYRWTNDHLHGGHLLEHGVIYLGGVTHRHRSTVGWPEPSRNQQDG